MFRRCSFARIWYDGGMFALKGTVNQGACMARSCVGAKWVGLVVLFVSGIVSADWRQWSNVDLAQNYTFKGTVLEDKDLSGLACISPEQCLVGADEGHQVQLVRFSRQDKTLTALQSVSLMHDGDELDIEAIAAEGDFYYVLGSHGVAKKTGEHQANRFSIFRLKVDRTTGAPGRVEIATLSGVLQADPMLSRYFGKPLQKQGLNIEGLAIRDGQLFVGLRNPNLGGYAYVLEIAGDDVFSGKKTPKYTLHKLGLGKGLGIREIVAGRSCFLIVAGNAGSGPSDVFPASVDYDKKQGYWMYAWDGAGVSRIGRIPNAPGKAEAMTILSETDTDATVLILFDGPKEGRPSVYRIH